MLTVRNYKELTVEIPFVGTGTLLPINQLPENMRCYKNILLTANTSGLKELPRLLTVYKTNEIFRAVALRLATEGVRETESVTVILSGLHRAYTHIDVTKKEQDMSLCLTSLELFFWQNAKLSDNGALIKGPVVMQTNEIAAGSFIHIPEGDSIYCLFLERKVR